MFIKSILKTKGPDLISVSPQDSVRDVARLFKRERIGFALVNSAEGDTLGSISERDIVQALAASGDLQQVSSADIMTRNIVTCDIDDTIDSVRELMTHQRTRHVLVMNAKAMAGIVSIGDIIKHSLDVCKVDTSMMRDYIGGQGYQ